MTDKEIILEIERKHKEEVARINALSLEQAKQELLNRNEIAYKCCKEQAGAIAQMFEDLENEGVKIHIVRKTRYPAWKNPVILGSVCGLGIIIGLML